jgi:hypothetical protein
VAGVETDRFKEEEFDLNTNVKSAFHPYRETSKKKLYGGVTLTSFDSADIDWLCCELLTGSWRRPIEM